MGQKERVQGINAVKLIHCSYGKKQGFLKKVPDLLIGDIFTLGIVKIVYPSGAFFSGYHFVQCLVF
jgi:hypothetical protein